jgi:metallo-beta-lactamase family protein
MTRPLYHPRLPRWAIGLLLCSLATPATAATPRPRRKPLRLQVLGAAQMVTGSMHLLRGRDGGSLLMDCGMFQGPKAHREKNHRKFPEAALKAGALVISHDHIDHCGMAARLVKEGFEGKIYATHESAKLLPTMLYDSARLQEFQAEGARRRLKGHAGRLERRLEKVRQNPKKVKNGDPKLLKKELPEKIAALKQKREAIEPLYTEEDVTKLLERVVPVGYGEEFEPVPGMKVRLEDAAHIFGSATVLVDTEGSGGKQRRIAFSGDLGRREGLLFGKPTPPRGADYVVMEGTNGDTEHPTLHGVDRRLEQLIDETKARGGKLMIPSFAQGRTQELLFLLSQIAARGKLSVPVYVDSPMAVEVTRLFRENLHAFNDKVREHAKQAGRNPFDFPGLHLIESVDESRELVASKDPAVIISTAGMCNAGRILHHLAGTIANKRNTVVFVGYQAKQTLGRRLLTMVDAPDLTTRQRLVKIKGKVRRVAATIAHLPAMHGHGDRRDLLNWVDGAGDGLRKVFLVHGDLKRLEAIGRDLEQRGCQVAIPAEGQTFELD